ncbi:hypothetical protein D9615_002124 [Tricholomella constricta]|uniref:Lon protease AAA+ ATPase lid domain-containing protein n=1 Tax=Tricholomella constricta TaxID=117010 RepID=A0A8H5HP09_9AGAR|nr:hypothetical protein D9615_002124 [Tricholomella constricta]
MARLDSLANSTPLASEAQRPQVIKDKTFLTAARAQLDADHFGLEKIKKRLIEYLAVQEKEVDAKGGREKTDVDLAIVPYGKSQQRSYPSPQAGPGKPGRLGKKGVKGPILLFVEDHSSVSRWAASAARDEIDKIGQSNFHGDPGAALLEVLDPEQNHTFNDHHVNVPIDLSQVLYTYNEKMHIARRFLPPKQLQANGLDESHITITEPALLHVATGYTREAGVRSLEHAIRSVVRYKAIEWAEFMDEGGEAGDVRTDDGAVVMADKGAGEKRAYQRVVEECRIVMAICRWRPLCSRSHISTHISTPLQLQATMSIPFRTDRVRIIIFVKRKPGLTKGEFSRYWKGPHAEPFMSLDIVKKKVIK